MKKIVLCIISVILLLSLSSCALIDRINMSKENTFTVNEILTDSELSDENREYYTSVSITLDGNFKRERFIPFMDEYAALYNSSKAKVMIKNEPISGDFDVSISEYAENIHGDAGPFAYPLETDENGIVSYRYNADMMGIKFSGVCYFFRTAEDYWQIDMACRPDDIEEMLPYFDEWAASVTFNEECPIYDYILE